MATAHVVWDWNGTLLDDFELSARVGVDSLAALGVPGLTSEDFRSAFARPFTVFYSRLMGRRISETEFDQLRARYEFGYAAEVRSIALQADAEAALALVAQGATQSILSMAPDVHLQEMIDHHGLRDRFVRVEGSLDGSDGTKARHMCRHLEAIGVQPDRVVVIGDTVDDQEAAMSCGARAVLVTTGAQAREELITTGSPVVDTLLEAATLAMLPRP